MTSKRLIITALAAFSASISVMADSIDMSKAQQIAEEFINKDRTAKTEVEYLCDNNEVNTRIGASSSLNVAPSYYIFNASDGKGFVMVSAEEEFPAVLGYSDEDNFSLDSDMPAALRSMLETIDEYVSDFRMGYVEAPNISAMKRESNFTTVSPLVSAKWSQSSPYNYYFPKISNSKCLVGCIATAMAQIIYSYKYPTQPTGSIMWDTYNTSIGSLTYNFDNVTFDYSQMTDMVTSSSISETKKQVGQLNYACAAAAKMEFFSDGSGAYDEDAMIGLYTYLGYSPSKINLTYRDYYSTQEEWNQIIYDEIMAGRPLIMGAVSSTSKLGDGEGHAFILDGIDSKGYVHVNWGWGGSSNGYYAIPYMNPSNTSYKFSSDQSIIYGIEPAEEGDTIRRQYSLTGFTPAIAWDDQVDANSTFNVSLGEFYNMSLYSHVFTLGIGLYDTDGNFVENVCTIEPEYMTTEFPEYTGIIDTLQSEATECRISSGIAEGEYTLRIISKEEGYNEWLEIDFYDGKELGRIPVLISNGNIYFNERATAIEGVAEDRDASGTAEYYRINGQRIVKPEHGEIYIEKAKNKEGKVVVRKKIG